MFQPYWYSFLLLFSLLFAFFHFYQNSKDPITNCLFLTSPICIYVSYILSSFVMQDIVLW